MKRGQPWRVAALEGGAVFEFSSFTWLNKRKLNRASILPCKLEFFHCAPHELIGSRKSSILIVLQSLGVL